jgi:hypothetical protein
MPMQLRLKEQMQAMKEDVWGRRIVYRGPELLHLVNTFCVERSFTERPNGSNSMEHQLLVVKR